MKDDARRRARLNVYFDHLPTLKEFVDRWSDPSHRLHKHGANRELPGLQNLRYVCPCLDPKERELVTALDVAEQTRLPIYQKFFEESGQPGGRREPGDDYRTALAGVQEALYELTSLVRKNIAS